MSLWKIILKQFLAWASLAASAFAFFWVVSNFSQVMGTAPQVPPAAEEDVLADSPAIPDFPETKKVSVGPKTKTIIPQEISTGLVLRDNPTAPKETLLKAVVSDVATFKGLKITDWIDFTNAEIRGLNVAVVNNYYTENFYTTSTASNPTAPPPLQNVYNSYISASPVNVQPVVGTIGGVTTDFGIGRNLVVGQDAVIGNDLTIATVSDKGVLTVNGTASITGNTTLGGTLTTTGASTFNGAVTLGDDTGDVITINGRLSTLNISDGSNTSTLTKNSLIINQGSSDSLGKFYIDSSGNTAASGTITAFGSQTASSTILSSDYLILGKGTSFNQGAFYVAPSGNLSSSGTLTVFGSQTASSSLLSSNLLRLGVGSGYNLGMFNVDASGNVSTSGTLNIGFYTTSTLPTSSTPGRLARVSNASRGLWMDQGTQWFSLGGEIFDVKEFGAKGDGTTNDYTAINNALSAAATAAGGIISFPPGTYYIGSQISWPSTSNISWIGSGRGRTVLVFNDGGSTDETYGIRLYDASCPARISNTAFKRMTMRGSANDNTAPTVLIQIHSCFDDILVEDVEFYWADSGVRATPGIPPNGKNLTIDNSYFHDLSTNSPTSQIGVGIDGGLNNTKILNSTFDNLGDNSLDHGIYARYMRGLLISHNYFKGTPDTYNNISTYSATNNLTGVTITGNVFENTPTHSFWNMDGGVVSGNSFVNTGLSTNSSLFVSGNTFLATTTGRTFVTVGYGASNVHIVGNEFRAATTTDSSNSVLGIQISQTTSGGYVTIKDNIFEELMYGVEMRGLAGANNNVVENNSFYNTQSWAANNSIPIYIRASSTQNIIKNNHLHTNSNYAIWDEWLEGVQTYIGNIITGGGSLKGAGSTDQRYNNTYITADVQGNVMYGATTSTTSTARMTIFGGGIDVSNAGTATTTVTSTYFILNRTSSNALGSFYLDSSGNTNTSGTLRVFGGATTGGLLVSATNSTTTLTSYITDAAGAAAFAFNSNATMTSGTDRMLAVFQNNGTNKVMISAGGNVYAKNSFIANSSDYGIGDVAEYVNLIPNESVEPGDVLVVSKDTPNKYKKSSSAYTKEIAGVVSDTGAFVMGAAGTDRAALALAGLVKVKVSVENGAISIGDYLVSAAKPGYAMKYDAVNPPAGGAGLVGMALEPATTNGLITILVNKGLVSGALSASADLTVSVNNNDQLTQNGPLDLNGFSIINISYVKAKNDTWQIDENGNLVQRLKTEKGDKDVYNLASNEKENLIFSGIAQLENGQKQIVFDELDREIISQSVPLKIFITPSTDSVELFVSERSFVGFTVKEKNSGVSNTAFDWLAIAHRKTQSEIDAELTRTDADTNTTSTLPPPPYEGGNEGGIGLSVIPTESASGGEAEESVLSTSTDEGLVID